MKHWVKSGYKMASAPMAKSYRLVTNVLPIMAKAINRQLHKLPVRASCCVGQGGSSENCLCKKNLRAQPLPAKVLVIGVMGMAANVPLGIWREHTEKFSPSWFAAIHAAVPFIAMLRKSVLMPKSAMAFTIAASVLGQVIGSRTEAMVGASDQVGTTGGHCGECVEWESASLQDVMLGWFVEVLLVLAISTCCYMYAVVVGFIKNVFCMLCYVS